MGKASRKKRTVSNAISLAKSRHSELPTSTKRGILYNPIFHILLIAIIGFMSYSNTFNVPFHFDDTSVIVENPIIKNIRFFIEPSEAKVYSEHFQYPSFSMRHIGYFTFALNYKVHGLDVTGYHFVNLFIHIINGLLVYLLIVLTFRTPFLDKSPLKDSSRLIAIFAALLFVCHPIQTQAVTYIWQRVTSLATMFYLLSLAMYIKARLVNQSTPSLTLPPRGGGMGGGAAAKRYTLYAISLISAILAMKTKEISFTLPVVIALYEFMFFKGKIKRRILYLIPLMLTMLIIPLTLIGIDKPLGDVIGELREAAQETKEIPRWSYLFTQFRVIVTYIRLLFSPINQNLDYDYPVYDSFLNPNVFLSFLFLLSIFSLGIYLLYRSRFTVHSSQSSDLQLETCNLKLVSFGIFWFFITLSVESSIIPIRDIIFEHRLYLPSVGVFIAIATSTFILASKLKRKWPQTEKTVTPVLALIIIILSIAAYARNIVWQDEVSLWEDVVRKSPEKARGYNEVGVAYKNKGRIDMAIKHFQIALRLDPYLIEAYNNLGLAYYDKGWVDEAIEQYQTFLKLKLDNADVHYNLGIAYYAKGWTDKAIEHYQIALRLKPDDADIHNNIGIVYKNKGRIDKAIEHLWIALRIKPDFAKAYNNLGLAYHDQGRLDEAIQAYLTALRLKPDYVKAYYNLGVTYEKKGLLREAIKQYQTALRLNPELKVARDNLNKLLRIKGK